MSLLERRLTRKWADEVLRENGRLTSAIIYDLQEKGKEVAAELKLKDYDSLETFLEDHDNGKSPFGKLEGEADRDGNVLILKNCPMTAILDSVMVGGKLPEFYQTIVDKYTAIHKTKGAILHPFCIVHQVIRATVGEHVKVEGKPMKVHQVACRSMNSGKIVYATEGTSKVAIEKEDIHKKIEGKACMYLVKV